MVFWTYYEILTLQILNFYNPKLSSWTIKLLTLMMIFKKNDIQDQ